jgi:pyruvate dehydrogenase E2 component (dihydrolipoamide acetyltransferase)
MISELLLPVLDQTGGEFLVAKWLKSEGNAVRNGEPLCEVETGKANVEIEANATGILRQVLIPAGTSIPALTVLALIGAANDPLPTIDPFYRVSRGTRGGGQVMAAPPIDPLPAPPLNTQHSVLGAQHSPPVSPRARKLATEYGIDLSTVIGSGPGGRIIEDDVMRAIEAGG